MKQLVERFASCPVLVFGDYMIDEYVYGTVERISPEAPVVVVKERERKRVPGGAGNVVRNLRSLGAPVLAVGLVGVDEAAHQLNRDFKELGMEDSPGLLRMPERPTTLKTRILAGNQQVCRLDREISQPISRAVEELLFEAALSALEEAKAVIFSDYDKGVVVPGLISRITGEAHRRGLFIAVDPQVSHFHTYRSVDVLTPNHHEAGRFLGRVLDSDAAVESGGWEIIGRLDARMLLITRGEKGMSLFIAADHSCAHFPTKALEVFDVTGAGDTVISIFTLAMAAGAAPHEAVELSNRGAGIVVGHIGAAVVTPEELLSP